MTEAAESSPRRPRRPARAFLLWLGAFYAAWLAIAIGGGHGATAAAHWPIAVAMAAGSYVAGSTPMGGGTVGFPILVLVFGESASLGRDFAFAIQSIGMTSASIFILAHGAAIERRFLAWAIAGSAVGTPLGVALVAPAIPETWAKMLFAVVWASFGVMHFVRIDEICAAQGIRRRGARFDRVGGLAVGLLGGACVASVTGVGIDMMLYVALVLLARADLKIAIPTSVILMASTSLIGIATRLALAAHDPVGAALDPELFGNWVAAAPVVAVGAPLGAWVVQRIGRRPTLLVVSGLCLVQFAWMAWSERERLGAWGIAAAVLAVLAVNAAFHAMWTRARREPSPAPPASRP